MKKLFSGVICGLLLLTSSPIIADDVQTFDLENEPLAAVDEEIVEDFFLADPNDIDISILNSLSNYDEAVLLDEEYYNVSKFSSKRFNMSANLVLTNSYTNIWIQNKGRNTIRAYTETKYGNEMDYVYIRPGEGKLLKITAQDVEKYGEAYMDGYHILSYFVKANGVDGRPISLRARVKYYSGYQYETAKLPLKAPSVAKQFQ